MKQPDNEDRKKLNRVLFFINRKIDDKRITGANNLHEIQTYVDLYHALHMDTRGHIGGVSTFVMRF